MQISAFLLQGFLFFCKLLHIIETQKTYLYKNVPVIRYLTNYICYILKYIYCSTLSQRIEPFSDSWNSICWMTSYDASLTQSHKYYETYENQCMITHIYTFMDHFMTVLYGQHEVDVINIIEPVEDFFIKINPIAVIKTEHESTSCYVVAFDKPDMSDFNIKKSKACFLTIEYRHPEMETPIDFTLDKEWMISGNVLFTPTFVLRMLEYQSRSYYYDDRYIIRIIDKDININDFGMDRYIELTDTGYLLQGLELDEYNKCMTSFHKVDSEIIAAEDADVDNTDDNSDEYSFVQSE